MELLRQVSLICLIGVVIATPAISQVGEETPGPQEVIESSNQDILDLYATSGEGPEVNREVFALMDAVTSFSSIAASTIDEFCEDPSDEECAVFKDVFVKLLRVSSIKKLGRYRADSFEYLAETIDGDTAEVKTLARYGDDDIELDYYLHSHEDGWVIVNYVVDGIDTIKNYRKQFSRMLRQSSIEAVIERLAKRVEDLESET
jgi:phospholipid transport system substrate-binding protein